MKLTAAYFTEVGSFDLNTPRNVTVLASLNYTDYVLLYSIFYILGISIKELEEKLERLGPDFYNAHFIPK